MSSGRSGAVIDVLKSQKQIQKPKGRRINYTLYDDQYFACRYMFECGYKLKFHPISIAKATIIFHKFMRGINDSSLYDKYLIASTCLYIAGKARDEKVKLRDVINVAHHTLNRKSEFLGETSEDYMKKRSSIVQAELLIMRVLLFDVNFPCPHTYLFHYLKTIRSWIPSYLWAKTPISEAAYGFLQDVHHDPVVLDFLPQTLALGCINLALEVYGVQVPYRNDADNLLWYSCLYHKASRDDVWEVMDAIMNAYEKQDILMRSHEEEIIKN